MSRRYFFTHQFRSQVAPNQLRFIQSMNQTTQMDIINERGEAVDIIKHESLEQDLANRFIEPEDVVLELGARYGSVSCIINSKLSDNTKQVSVEPDSRVWEALERNKIANKCNFNIVKGFISNYRLGLLLEPGDGYGTTSIKQDDSLLDTFTLDYIQSKYDLKFNVLVADCEGFLETFFNENPTILHNLRMVIFEADCPHTCNYDKIRTILSKNGLVEIVALDYLTHEKFQNVWKRM